MKLVKTASMALAATLSVSVLLPFSSTPALAAVSGESLLEENGGDIPADHWAKESVLALVDKYKVVSGFPDKTFKGKNNMSRYELAVALYKVMQYVDSRPTGDNGVDMKMLEAKFATKEDLKTIAALQMEFKKELEKVMDQTNKLNERVDMLERVQVHGGVEVRVRNRSFSTDGTTDTSPLFNAKNEKNKEL